MKYYYLFFVFLCYGIHAQNSLLFNGAQYVTIQSPKFSDYLDQSFTIEATINQKKSSGKRQNVLHYYNRKQQQGFIVFIQPNGTLVFQLNNQNYSFGDFLIHPNNCYTFSIVRRHFKLQLYVNGKLQASHVVANRPLQLASKKNFYIGGKRNSIKNFIGEIDEVRLYQKAMSANWINAHLKHQLEVSAYDNLTAYYSFNATQTQVVHDAKELNNGVLGDGIGNDTKDPFRNYSGCIDIDRRLVGGNIDLKQKPGFECAPVPQDNSELSAAITRYSYTDRWGNKYCSLDTQNNVNKAANNYTTDGGMFDLTISGFADPAMANVITQVFEDVETLLVQQPNPCTNEFYTAKILIDTSTLYPGVGATGTAFYPYRGELQDVHIGEVADRINGKPNRLAFFGAPPLPYDGQITISDAINNWYTGFDPSAIPPTTFDFYSTVLHQVMHVLGLSSQIKKNGDKINYAKQYALWDTRLFDNNLNESLIDFDSAEVSLNHNWFNNTSTSALSSGCSTVRYQSDTVGDLPVYAPPFFVNGSSLSHLDDLNCGIANPNPVLMGVSAAMGVAYRMQTEDLSLLRDLGFEISNQYGSNSLITGGLNPNLKVVTPSDPFIVHDDFGTNCTNAYNYKVGDPPLTIALNDVLANDAIGTANVEFHSVVGVRDGKTLVKVGNDYLFSTTENFTVGMNILRYMLKELNGTRVSGYGYVFVRVAPADDFWLDPNQDNCNLIPNGSFDTYKETVAPLCVRYITNGIFPNYGSSYYPEYKYNFRPTMLNNWMPLGGSPDIQDEACDVSIIGVGRYEQPSQVNPNGAHIVIGNQYTSLYNDQYNEGIFTKVPIVQGKEYTLSYFRARAFNQTEDISLRIRLFKYNELNNDVSPYHNRRVDIAGDYPYSDIDEVFTGNFQEFIDIDVSANDWEQNIICFTANDNYDAMAFINTNTDGAVHGSGIDQIELIEDTFDTSPVTAWYANGSEGLTIGQDDCELTNRYYSWSDITDQTNPIVLSQGTTITADGLSAGVTFPSTNTTGSEIVIAPDTTRVYQLVRNFSSDPSLGGNSLNIASSTCQEKTANYTIRVAATPYISQVYEGISNDQFIEVKNSDGVSSIIPGSYYLALYADGAVLTGAPSATVDIALGGDISPEEARVFRNNLASSSTIATPGLISDLGLNFTFDGNNDIIILSRTNDATAWDNRVDIIGDHSAWSNPSPLGEDEDWGQNQTWVRSNCASMVPNATYFDASDWVSFSLTEVSTGGAYDESSKTNPILGRHWDDQLSYLPGGWDDLSADESNPDRSRQIVIDANYDMRPGVGLPSFEACNLTVNPFANVWVDEGDYISVEIAVLVRANGSLNILNKGALVMVKDAYNGVEGPDLYVIENGGSTYVKQSTVGLDSPYDYVFWSSPLSLHASNLPSNRIDALFPSTVFDATRFNTFINAHYYDEFSGPGYPQTEAGSDGFDDNGDDYQIVNAMARSELMIPGRGYCTWPPQDLVGDFNYSIVFNGQPNNGLVTSGLDGATTDVWRNTSQNGSNFNLVGNPYPSAIDLDVFFAANSALIDPIAYIWGRSLVDEPSDSNDGPLDQNYLPEAFLIYNPMMTVTVPSQFANSNPFNSDGILSSCQSFFVQTVQNLTSTNNTGQANNEFVGDIVFTNSMRTRMPNTTFSFTDGGYASTSFVEEVLPADEGKLWLNIVDERLGTGSQMGIAFQASGSSGFKSTEDVRTVYGRPLNIYSRSSGAELIIDTQGYFSSDIKIPLGVSSLIARTETLRIGIDHTEGVLNTASIYLEDTVLGVLHDLRSGDYEFRTGMAVADDRFVLRFDTSSPSLVSHKPTGIEVLSPDANALIVSTTNGMEITDLSIIDLYQPSLSGNMLLKETGVNQQRVEREIAARHKVLYIKATLADASVHTKKIIR